MKRIWKSLDFPNPFVLHSVVLSRFAATLALHASAMRTYTIISETFCFAQGFIIGNWLKRNLTDLFKIDIEQFLGFGFQFRIGGVTGADASVTVGSIGAVIALRDIISFRER
jgi:hypothetical protein